MEITIRFTTSPPLSTMYFDITITNLAGELWESQLLDLKKKIDSLGAEYGRTYSARYSSAAYSSVRSYSVIAGRAESQREYRSPYRPGLSRIYYFSFTWDLTEQQLNDLAQIVKGDMVGIVPYHQVVANAAETSEGMFIRQCAFVEALLSGTTVVLSSASTLAQAQIITQALPAGTLLRLENIGTTPSPYLHIGSLADLIFMLPENVMLSIAPNRTKAMIQRQLDALPLTRIAQLPPQLTPMQCQWVGTYAKSGSTIQLPNHFKKSAGLGILNALQANRYLRLALGTNSALIYHIITALPPSERRCCLVFDFPPEGLHPPHLDSASSSAQSPPLSLGLKADDWVYIPLGADLERVEHLLNDKSSCGMITFRTDSDPRTAIAIASQLERTGSEMQLFFGSHLTRDWMAAFTQGMPKDCIIRLQRCMAEGGIIRFQPSPIDWLIQLARIMPTDGQIMLPSDISVLNATALAQYLAPHAILLIQGSTPPAVLKAVAEHIKSPARIRLDSSVSVDEALFIATHITSADVFEVNPLVPATMHPDVSAAIELCRTNERLRLDPMVISETSLKHIIESQRGADIIDLPANIRACTPETLRQALRKLQGVVRLHRDTSIEFGTMVATALPNSMALMVPTDVGIHNTAMMPRIDEYTMIAIVRALKPGNKLYVQVVSRAVLTAILALPPQVTLLLDMKIVSQRDARMMIRLLKPGRILSLVAPEKVLDNLRARNVIKSCVGELPQGCILKVVADMGAANIHHIAVSLSKGRTLLIPRALLVAPFPLLDIILAVRALGATLMLPQDISQSEVGYFIDCLASNLSIALPSSGLTLSSEQWRKLAQSGAKVSGPLVFPADMSPLEMHDITQRLQSQQRTEPMSITPATAPISSSSSQPSSLFVPSGSKRNVPEPSSTTTPSVLEPSATTPNPNPTGEPPAIRRRLG